MDSDIPQCGSKDNPPKTPRTLDGANAKLISVISSLLDAESAAERIRIRIGGANLPDTSTSGIETPTESHELVKQTWLYADSLSDLQCRLKQTLQSIEERIG